MPSSCVNSYWSAQGDFLCCLVASTPGGPLAPSHPLPPQDWDYVVAGSMHLTLEVSEEKHPPESAIPRLWSENQEALIALPLASLIGE